MLSRIKQAVRNLLLSDPSKANYKVLLKAHSGLFDRTLSSKILETKCFTDILQPIVMDVPDVKRVLVVAPHADDDIFGAGGVLLQLVAKGVEIRTAYVTDAGKTPDIQAAIQNEARLISKELGSTPIFFNGIIGSIHEGGAEQKSLTAELMEFRPDIVFTTFLLDDHSDHREVNRILSASLQEARLKPEIWSYQIYSTVIPNVVIDITNVMKQKERLMRMWKSVTGNRNWAHYIRGMNAMNCRFIPGTEKIYGEAFFVLPVEEYIDICDRFFRASKVS